MFFVVGLGNPGEEYQNSRHNTGKMAVNVFSEKGKAKNVKVIDSGEFMNNSGRAVAKAMAGKAKAQKLIVIQDDMDLPIGKMKISYNKSSGGHRGVESIIKAVKTQEFIRIRIGIAPTTPGGKIKKPDTEKKVLDFILGSFKPSEMEILKKVFKKVSEAIGVIVEEGYDRAMNRYN